MEKEMHTVKEWAGLTGLKLYEYEGFVEMYFKLSETDTSHKFRDAGDITCSKEAFQSCLCMCTMEHPRMDKLVELADILPIYAESEINNRIPYGEFAYPPKNKDIIVSDLKRTLELLKCKLAIRDKVMSKDSEEASLEKVNNNRISYNKIDAYFNKVKTVEQLETLLIKEITDDINKMLENGKLNRLHSLYNKCCSLSHISYYSKRMGENRSYEEEFMFVDTPEDLYNPIIIDKKDRVLASLDGQVSLDVSFVRHM